jgi:hypothetical protein
MKNIISSGSIKVHNGEYDIVQDGGTKHLPRLVLHSEHDRYFKSIESHAQKLVSETDPTKVSFYFYFVGINSSSELNAEIYKYEVPEGVSPQEFLSTIRIT